MSVKTKLETLKASLGPAVQERVVTIGEASETFHFKRLSYADNQRIQSIPFSVKDGKPSFDVKKAGERNCALLASSLCDENGFTQLNALEAAQLDQKIAEPLIKAATEVNGLNDDAEKDAVKNSEATASDDSSSD